MTHSFSIPASQPRFREVQRADELRRVKLDRFKSRASAHFVFPAGGPHSAPSTCKKKTKLNRPVFACEPAQQEESSECLLVHPPLRKPAVPFVQVRALIPRPRVLSGSYLRPVRRSNWSFQVSIALIFSGSADKIGAVCATPASSENRVVLSHYVKRGGRNGSATVLGSLQSSSPLNCCNPSLKNTMRKPVACYGRYGQEQCNHSELMHVLQ